MRASDGLGETAGHVAAGQVNGARAGSFPIRVQRQWCMMFHAVARCYHMKLSILFCLFKCSKCGCWLDPLNNHPSVRPRHPQCYFVSDPQGPIHNFAFISPLLTALGYQQPSIRCANVPVAAALYESVRAPFALPQAAWTSQLLVAYELSHALAGYICYNQRVFFSHYSPPPCNSCYLSIVHAGCRGGWCTCSAQPTSSCPPCCAPCCMSLCPCVLQRSSRWPCPTISRCLMRGMHVCPWAAGPAASRTGMLPASYVLQGIHLDC